MKIQILLPVEGCEKMAPVWANEERFIDFRKEPERAARCTMSFAATELKHYLTQTINDCEITFSQNKGTADFTIILHADSLILDGEEFDLSIQDKDTIVIHAQGRVGVLYGAYEFLKLQGWRWYEPGEKGECPPIVTDHLVLPEKAIGFHPLTTMGRGFVFEDIAKESEEVSFWMARNKMNLGGYRPMSGPIMRKLGIRGDRGGHIFEAMLDPDREMPSGKTLWEEHPEWYGTPENREKTKAGALKTQFCVSQPDLCDFLAEEVLTYATGEWNDADTLVLATFDTWGSSCNCEKCRKLGNGTDKYFHFMSVVRDHINKARANGTLDHDVQLSLDIYEGTATFLPPENPVPQNLLDAGDIARMAVILRCYQHDFDDPACDWNSHYNNTLKAWAAKENMLPIRILEYYNVSKFEDLPLLFSQRIKNDIPYYQSLGVTSFTYMHPPMVNWAMRSLTQVLYAELTADPNADADAIIEEYFQRRFGAYAPDMKKAYALIEQAWLTSANWRAWGSRSILSQLQVWDGCKPASPLNLDAHFANMEALIESGRQSVAMLQEALNIFNVVRKQEKKSIAIAANNLFVGTIIPVNPAELHKLQNQSKVEHHIGEHIRLQRYGLNVMALMTEIVNYYHMLYLGNKQKADEAWHVIEQLEEEAESYYIPLSYEMYKVMVISKDALTRSQLREVIRRCRKDRIANGKE